MAKEIEYKFLLTLSQKNKLEKFLRSKKAKFIGSGSQDNWYYQAPGKNDLRIRRTDQEAYLILKKGWMHDSDRDEIEIKVERKDFENLDEILRALGYKYDTKWYRKRIEYKLDSFNITIDFNAGYGWLAEIEKVVQSGGEEKAKKEILDLADKIGLQPVSKDFIDKMYHYYKKHWPYYIRTKKVFDRNKIK